MPPWQCVHVAVFLARVAITGAPPGPWPGLNACVLGHARMHLALRCAAARCRLQLQFTSLQQFPLPNRGNIMQGGKLGLGDEKLQEIKNSWFDQWLSCGFSCGGCDYTFVCMPRPRPA